MSELLKELGFGLDISKEGTEVAATSRLTVLKKLMLII